MTLTTDIFQPGDGLLIVDVQKCFCGGGSLPVPGCDAIIPVINELSRQAAEQRVPAYASRDFHPKGHISFKEHGGPWPSHCIQDTGDAAFHPQLELPPQTLVVTKGVRFDQDQNSAFDQTGLERQLEEDGVRRLVVCGLALDVCVLASVLDARRLGLEVLVILSATRPVSAEGGRRAVAEMEKAGARLVHLKPQ